MPNGSSRARVFRWLKAVAIIVLVILLVPYAVTPLYRVVNPVSTLVLWRWATGARVERTWTPLAGIAPALPQAVISAEDGRFCRHWGIDFAELRDAMVDADRLSEMRGGSTITQQTAKNLFLWPGRSYVRKVLEFPLALWMDLILGKRRVMEIYLNVAEWGPNGEFGAAAAARSAFSKSPKDISAREAATLAAILPNPIERSAARPGPGVRRLAGLYERRAGRFGELAACVRR